MSALCPISVGFDQAAVLLDVSRDSIEALVHAGAIKAFQLPGLRRRLLLYSDVMTLAQLSKANAL